MPKKGKQITTHVAIVGGGFSGTMLVVQLVKMLPPYLNLHLTIIEKTGKFAQGLAYSTKDPYHFLNVRANRMGAFSKDPQHFYHWLLENEDTWKSEFPNLKITPDSYLPRILYAHYLKSLLEEAKQEAALKKIKLTFISEEAKDIELLDPSSIKILLSDQKFVIAKAIVLATNVPSIQNFEIDEGLSEEIYTDNIWSPKPNSILTFNSFSRLNEKTRVAIIGSGLTMVDVAISLIEKGYEGEIIVISKKGNLPAYHVEKNENISSPFNLEKMPNNVLALYGLVRKEIRLAEKKGTDWRAVFDALRPITLTLWERLPLNEQKKFVRHVLPIWNKCRHRIPVESYRILKSFMTKKKIHFIKGSVRSIQCKNMKANIITFEGKNIEADYVLNCSGPLLDVHKNPNLLLKNLLKKKIIQANPLKLGIVADEHYKVVGNQNLPIYALGQLLYGQKLESLAVPELRDQCASIAKELCEMIRLVK